MGGGEKSGLVSHECPTDIRSASPVWSLCRYGSDRDGRHEETVENTTTGTLSQVRVEVHLSNGVELGLTNPMDLCPGQVMDFTLSAAGQIIVWFTAHPEVE